jgi:hypothetical protein
VLQRAELGIISQIAAGTLSDGGLELRVVDTE